MIQHCIYWPQKNKSLQKHVCSLIGIRPILTVNGTTYAGTLSERQLQMLQPYVENKDIQIRSFLL